MAWLDATDLIFPFFLFIVGITTHLSLAARQQRGDDDRTLVVQVLRRGGIIILLGLFLSGFPFIPKYGFDLSTMRIPGVLQRIGVAYIAAALLTLRTTSRTQVIIVTTLLLGYWAAMTLVPVPGSGMVGALALEKPDASLAAWLDRTLLGDHLWRVSKTWDPEGILSTVPAIGTAMLGVFAGRWIGSARPLAERIAGLFAVGSIGMVAGLVWGWWFPINKKLWTSSYVVFTAGMASVTIATCMWMIDVRRMTFWTKPFVVFGMNPIVAFVGSGMMARLMESIIKVQRGGETVSLQTSNLRRRVRGLARSQERVVALRGVFRRAVVSDPGGALQAKVIPEGLTACALRKGLPRIRPGNVLRRGTRKSAVPIVLPA